MVSSQKPTLSRWIAALVISFAGALPVQAQLNDALPKEVQNVGVEQKVGGEIPGDLSFKDETGKQVYLGKYFDGKRPVLLSLNYSNCPMLCTVQLNGLSKALKEIDLAPGSDFEVLSISIDPKETPDKAAATKDKYVKLVDRAGVADAWHFLTGDSDSIRAVADAVGFRYRYDTTTKEYYHPAMLAFIAPNRTITSYQLSVDYPTQQLKLGLMDAANGKVGSVIDTLPLLCFMYDAERGSYVLSAWRLMRLGGAVTVLILLVTLLPFWIGKRRMPRGNGSPVEGTELNDTTPGHLPTG